MRLVRWVLPVALVVVVPPRWFLVLWSGAFAWHAHWWAFQVCTEVRVEAGRLAWRTMLRSGDAPVTDVTRVRPSRWGQRQMALVEVSGRRPLLVPVRYGFERLSLVWQTPFPGCR